MKWKPNDFFNQPPVDVEIEVETDSGIQQKAVLEDGLVFKVIATGRTIMEGVSKWRNIKNKSNESH